MQTVFLNLPSPFSAQQFHLPAGTPLSSLPLPFDLSPETYYLRTRSSAALPSTTLLSSLRNAASPAHPITLDLCVRLPGGKGGFGSQLRAAGGRMSKSKGENNDSCRDLSGRRLSTIKEAQRQADLLESAPALAAAATAAQKAKLEALERSLGLSSAAESSASGSGSAASGVKRIADVDVEELARKKHRFEDTAFLEESREINDNVRKAVTASLLKKRKKKNVEAETQKETDKVAMPPPAVVV
ncbi:replication stress response regulator SDE2, partial [Tremellales sp. Uapishka_1]